MALGHNMAKVLKFKYDFIENSLHCSIKNERIEILMKKMKKMYIQLEKSHLYKKLNIIEPQLYSLHLKLSNQLNNDWNEFDALVEKANSIKLILTEESYQSSSIKETTINRIHKNQSCLMIL
jgi:hypothetical protein